MPLKSPKIEALDMKWWSLKRSCLKFYSSNCSWFHSAHAHWAVQLLIERCSLLGTSLSNILPISNFREFANRQNIRDWPSVLWHCWMGVRKGIQPVKTWVMRCWRGYLLEWSANSLHMVQLMLLPPHHVCFSKIQNGLSFWYRLTWVVPDKGS